MRLEGSGEPKRDSGQKRTPGTEVVLENAESGEIWSRKKERQERVTAKEKVDRESLKDTERVTEELSQTGTWSRGLGE